jgi:hypothetical protein
MNIIFGDTVKQLPDSFTILELDTIRTPPENIPVTAYCVIEKIPLSEFPLAEHYLTLHADVIKNYRERHWEYCEQAIEGLMGKWGGELDSFYTSLSNRIKNYKENPPDDSWDGTYLKTSSK